MAGVSTITAARAMGGYRNVRPDLVARVREAAEALGYRADAGARALRRTKSMALGIVFDNLDSPVKVSILKGIDSECQGQGYALLVTNAQNDEQAFRMRLDRLLERRVDGLFVVNQAIRGTPQMFDNLRAAPVPVLSLFYVGNDTNRGLPVVTANETQGMLSAVERLLNLGHRCVLQVLRSRQVGGDRDKAVLAALERGGGSRSVLLMRDDQRPEDVAQEIEVVMSQESRPTAIIATEVLIPAIYQAIQRSGLRIPDDVSVVSLLDSAFNQVLSPPVASVKIDDEHVGRASAAVMLEWLQGHAPPSPVTYVEDAIWVERGSIGPAPKI